MRRVNLYPRHDEMGLRVMILLPLRNGSCERLKQPAKLLFTDMSNGSA